MKKTLATILLLFGVLQLFGQTSYKQNIADLISLSFPEKPAVNDTLGHTIFQYADTAVIYMALYRKIDPNDLPFKKEELPEFYDGMIKGIMGAAQGKLISKKPFEINGLKGVDIEFTSTDPDLPNLRFMRLLLINNTIITTHILTQPQNKQATHAARSKFFNSLTIIADKTTLTQGSEGSTLLTAAYITGIILFFMFAGAVVAGILFLIRRLSPPSKSPH